MITREMSSEELFDAICEAVGSDRGFERKQATKMLIKGDYSVANYTPANWANSRAPTNATVDLLVNDGHTIPLLFAEDLPITEAQLRELLSEENIGMLLNACTVQSIL